MTLIFLMNYYETFFLQLILRIQAKKKSKQTSMLVFLQD